MIGGAKALCADSVVGITGGFTPLTGFSFPSHLECGSAAGAPQVILNYEAALTLGSTTKNGGGGEKQKNGEAVDHMDPSNQHKFHNSWARKIEQ